LKNQFSKSIDVKGLIEEVALRARCFSGVVEEVAFKGVIFMG